MPEYRFYQLTDDGHINKPAKSYNLPDDDAALAKAHQIIDGHDIEVWQQLRLVARVKKKAQAAKP